MSFYRLGATVLLLCAVSMSAIADSVADIKFKLAGKSASYTEDRRHHDVLGCHGDTVETGVNIQNVDVSITGNTANVTVSYVGTYRRFGWSYPCTRAGNPEEAHTVYGKLPVILTQQPFSPLQVSIGPVFSFGEASDVNHDSNVTAVKAATSIINGAFD